MAESSKERYTLFWRIESPFSQFHPAEFSVDGVKYNCAEQFMMHQKAKLFGDEEIAAAIMAETVPRKIKGLGRQVRNFDENTWKPQCRDIVKRGNLAKFLQNEDLKEKLLQTEGTILVEASPHDRIWGIGLAAENPAALRKSSWRGSNWLGYTLTDVREEIKKDLQEK